VAISVVQVVRVTATHSGTITASSAGNTLVAAYAGSAGGGSTGTCSVSGITAGGTALTKAFGQDDGASASASCSEIWYLANIASGITSLTVTGTGTVTADAYWIIWEIAGLGTAPTVDKTSAGPLKAGTTSWTSNATAALSAAAELAIGITAHGPNTGAGGTITGPATLWTNQTSFFWSGGGTAIGGHQITSATTAVTYSGTTSTFDFYTAVVATFLPGGAAGPPFTAIPGPSRHPRLRRPVVIPLFLPPTQFPLADIAAAEEDLTSTGIQATVPEADTGAAVESSVASATVPVADTGAATEGLSVTAAVPLADPGAGADAEAAAASVPLADEGAAAETPTVAAATPLGDAAGGTDGNQVGIPTSDTAGAAEALSVAVAVPLADDGAAADTNRVGIPTSDAGAAADAVAISSAISFADAGAAADANAVGIPTGDSGAAAEALAVAATVPLAEAGGGVDISRVGIPTADLGAATEALAVSVAVPLAEEGGASDLDQVGIPTSDAGAGSDAMAVSAAVPLAEAGAGADADGVGIPTADAGGASEALAVAAAVPLGEAGAAADASGVGIPTADTAGAAEQFTVAAAVPLADEGGPPTRSCRASRSPKATRLAGPRAWRWRSARRRRTRPPLWICPGSWRPWPPPMWRAQLKPTATMWPLSFRTLQPELRTSPLPLAPRSPWATWQRPQKPPRGM